MRKPEGRGARRHRGLPGYALWMSALCGLQPVAAAPEEAPAVLPAQPQATTEQSGPIEEVEIIGQRPLQFLIHDMEEAEVQMFDLFNRLNDNREFRVVCRAVIITGSKIPGRECVPVFLDRARSLSTREFLEFGTIPPTDDMLWAANRHKTEAFNAEIRALARQHPELATAMLDVQAKKEQIEVVKQRQQQKTRRFWPFGKKDSD